MLEATEVEIAGQTVEVTVDNDGAMAEVKETPFDRFMNEMEEIAESFSHNACVVDTRGYGSMHHNAAIIIPCNISMNDKDISEIFSDVTVRYIGTVDSKTSSFDTSDVPFRLQIPKMAFFVHFDVEKYE